MKEIKYGSCLLAVFVVFCGLVALVMNSAESTVIIEYLKRNPVMKNMELSTPIMVLFITVKNIIACAIVALLSCWVYGIPIFMFIVVNAITIGAVFSEAGFSWLTLSYIFPHCIFELTAILIALGLGWRIWRSGAKTTKRDIIMFAKTVIPLLIIGAIVESYITPMVILTTWG